MAGDKHLKVAVHSGHTQSVVLAYADDVPLTVSGETMIVETGPSLNIHCPINIDEAKTCEVLADNLNKILNALTTQLVAPWQHAFTPEDRLVLALPGVSTMHDLAIGHSIARLSKWQIGDTRNYAIVDDTYAGLIAGARSTRGICAFAGTGASVYMGTSDGEDCTYFPTKPFKFDGLGPMLGDHGSGFRLAMTALETIGRELDVCRHSDTRKEGRNPHGLPILFDALIEEIEKSYPKLYEEPSFLQNWFDDLMANHNPDWRFRIARLATIVTTAAEKGDPFARGLVEEAADSMVGTLQSALDLDDFMAMRTTRIYCQGGMFRHSRIYRERVAARMKDFGNVAVELARYRPCVGALLIAASHNWSAPDNEITSAIESAVSLIPDNKRHLVYNQP
jgi:N-acetylglucosamine kinase-like BadF-type ATPase